MENRTENQILNDALKYVPNEDIELYFLTESAEISNQTVDKIFKNLPKDIPYLELNVLRANFKHLHFAKIPNPKNDFKIILPQITL